MQVAVDTVVWNIAETMADSHSDSLLHYFGVAYTHTGYVIGEAEHRTVLMVASSSVVPYHM